MDHLPCKIDKCILFPTCMTKKSINCEHLRRHYEYLKHDIDVHGGSLWKILNETLPRMKAILGFVALSPQTRKSQYHYTRKIL